MRDGPQGQSGVRLSEQKNRPNGHRMSMSFVSGRVVYALSCSGKMSGGSLHCSFFSCFPHFEDLIAQKPDDFKSGFRVFMQGF